MASKKMLFPVNDNLPKTSTSRISRLVQPRKLSVHPIERRSASCDRQSNSGVDALASIPMPSATKRSRSATLRTPLRTPMKSLMNFVANAPQTTGKEKNKEVNEHAQRIMDVLRSDKHFGREYLIAGGLKSMSAKQFIDIVSHFFKFIFGNRFVISSNTGDDICHGLAQIGYPNMINKSWLKTPNIPNVYPQVVNVLHWLCQFIPKNTTISEVETEENCIKGEENTFPDQMYAKSFMVAAKGGFTLWNDDQQDEFDSLKSRLIDDFVHRQTNKFISKSSINEETLSLRRELQQQQKKRITVRNKDQCLKMNEELKMLESKQYKLQFNIDEINIRLASARDRLFNKDKEIDILRKDIVHFERLIESQPLTVHERTEILTRVAEKKESLAARNQAFKDVFEMSETKQVTSARLRKSQIDAIKNFNIYIYRIFQECGVENLCNITIDDLCVITEKSANINTKIKEIQSKLAIIHQALHKEKESLHYKFVDADNRLKTLAEEGRLILDERKLDLERSCHRYLADIQKLNVETMKNKRELERYVNSLQMERNKLINIIEIHIMDKDRQFKHFNRMNDANDRLLTDFKVTSNDLLTRKEECIQQVDELLDKLAHAMDGIKETYFIS